MHFQNKSFDTNKNSLFTKIADHNPIRRYANSVRLTYSPNKHSQGNGYQGFLNLNYYIDQYKSCLTDFTIFGNIKFTESSFPYEGNKEAIIVNIKKISLDFYECICDLYSKIENQDRDLGFTVSTDLNLLSLLTSNPEDKTFGKYGNTLYINIGNGIKYSDINGNERIIKSKNDISSNDLNQIMELKLIPRRLKYRIGNIQEFSMFIQIFNIKLTKHNAKRSDLDINDLTFSDDEEPENTDEIKNVIDKAFNKLKLNK
jgi:hypothetical protein